MSDARMHHLSFVHFGLGWDERELRWEAVSFTNKRELVKRSLLH